MKMSDAVTLGYLGYKATSSPWVKDALGVRLRIPLLAVVIGTGFQRKVIEEALLSLQQQGLISYELMQGLMGPELIWTFKERPAVMHVMPYVPAALPKALTTPPAELDRRRRKLGVPPPVPERGQKGRRERGVIGGFAPRVGKDKKFDDACEELAALLMERWGLDLNRGKAADRRNRLWTIQSHLFTVYDKDISVYIAWLHRWLRGSSRNWEDRVLPYAKVFKSIVTRTVFQDFMEYLERRAKLSDDVIRLYDELLDNEYFTDPQIYGYPSAFDFPLQAIHAALQTQSVAVVGDLLMQYRGDGLQKWLLNSRGGKAQNRGGWNTAAVDSQKRKLKRDQLIRQGTVDGNVDAALDHFYSDPKRGILKK